MGVANFTFIMRYHYWYLISNFDIAIIIQACAVAKGKKGIAEKVNLLAASSWFLHRTHDDKHILCTSIMYVNIIRVDSTRSLESWIMAKHGLWYQCFIRNISEIVLVWPRKFDYLQERKSPAGNVLILYAAFTDIIFGKLSLLTIFTKAKYLILKLNI